MQHAHATGVGMRSAGKNLAIALRPWGATKAGAVEAGQAGRRRVRFEQPAEWYQRLEIKEDAGRLRFVFPTDRARAELLAWWAEQPESRQ